MSITKTELSWYEKYKEADAERKILRKENERLLTQFSAMAADHARVKQKLYAVKAALNDDAGEAK